MMLDSNIKIDNKRYNVYANAFHDEKNKSVKLKAGFKIKLCLNLKKTFSIYPAIQKLIEKEIMPHAQSSGDDTIFFVGKDITCRAIIDDVTNHHMDELSVAASILFGVHTKGKNVWSNMDGVLLKFANLEPIVEESSENIDRHNNAVDTISKMLLDGRKDLIKLLSYGAHLNLKLGSQNEDLFTTPRQIDRGGMPGFGFECIETAAYDLIIPGEFNYTISDKIKKGVFHTGNLNARPEYCASGLQMTNIRSGQESNTNLPIFDALLVMQYNPYLVCGILPYYKIKNKFIHKSGGMILGKIPMVDFKFIISPTEYYAPILPPQPQIDDIDYFVSEQRGGFMKRLMKMPFDIPDDIPLQERW